MNTADSPEYVHVCCQQLKNFPNDTNEFELHDYLIDHSRKMFSAWHVYVYNHDNGKNQQVLNYCLV